MANPVFNKLEAEWEKTPAGYPSMPGYQPGGTGTGTATATPPQQGADPRYPYTAPTQPTQPTQQGQPQYDQSQWEDLQRQAQAPAADDVDRGRMTYDDVIMKTGLMLAIVIGSAAVSWFMITHNPPLGVALMGIGGLAGFILAMVNIFSKTIRPGLIMAYGVGQGLMLGGISQMFEVQYPGVVVQALIGTFAIFGVTLALFASGKVRNSSKLTRFVLIGLIGILVYRLLNFVLVLTGVLQGGGMNDVRVMGIPLGILVGIAAVLIGAACLIQDFDQAKVGVEMGAPAKFAWQCAFGLMVTMIWMYLEILQLLARIQNN